MLSEVQSAFQLGERRRLAAAVQGALQYNTHDDLINISRIFPPKYQDPGATLQCMDPALNEHLQEQMRLREENLSTVAAEYDLHYRDFQAESCRASSKFLDVADSMDPLRNDVSQARVSIAKAKKLMLNSISIQRLHQRQKVLMTLSKSLQAVQDVESKTIAVLSLLEDGDFSEVTRQLGLKDRAVPRKMTATNSQGQNSSAQSAVPTTLTHSSCGSPNEEGDKTSGRASEDISDNSTLRSSPLVKAPSFQEVQSSSSYSGSSTKTESATATDTAVATSHKLIIRLKCDAVPPISWGPLMVVLGMPTENESLLFPIHDPFCKNVLPFSFHDKENDPGARQHDIINLPQHGEGIEVAHTAVGRLALKRWFSLRHPENPLLIIALQKAVVTAILSRTTLKRYNMWGDDATTSSSEASEVESDIAKRISCTPKDIIEEECRLVKRFYEYYGAMDRTAAWVRKTVTDFYNKGKLDFMWQKLEDKYGSKAAALESSSDDDSGESPEKKSNCQKAQQKNETEREVVLGKSTGHLNSDLSLFLGMEVRQFVAAMEALDELGMPDEHCAEFIQITMKRALKCLIRRILLELTGEEFRNDILWTDIVKTLVPSEYRRFTLHVLSALMDVVRRVSVLRLQILRLKPDWSLEKQFSALGPDFVCGIGLQCVQLAVEFGRCISARGLDDALQVYHLIFMFVELLEVLVAEHRDACLSRFSRSGSLPTTKKTSPLTKLKRVPEELRRDLSRRLMSSFQSSVILTTMNSLKMETWMEFTAFNEGDFTGPGNSLRKLFWKILPSDAIEYHEIPTVPFTTNSHTLSAASRECSVISREVDEKKQDIHSAAVDATFRSCTLPMKYHEMMQLDLESRIAELTRKYDSKNVARIPSILQRYKGKEAQLISLLEDKYRVHEHSRRQSEQFNTQNNGNGIRGSNKRNVLAKLGYRKQRTEHEEQEEPSVDYGSHCRCLLGRDSLLLMHASVPNVFASRSTHNLVTPFPGSSTEGPPVSSLALHLNEKFQKLLDEEACEAQADKQVMNEQYLTAQRPEDELAVVGVLSNGLSTFPCPPRVALFSGYSGVPVFTSASFILFNRMAEWVYKARWCPNAACILLDLVTTLGMHYVHFVALHFGTDLLGTCRAPGPDSSTFAFIESDPSLPASFVPDARMVTRRAKRGLPKDIDFPLLLSNEPGATWKQAASNIYQLCAAHERIKALESMRTVVYLMKQSITALSAICCLPRIEQLSSSSSVSSLSTSQLVAGVDEEDAEEDDGTYDGPSGEDNDDDEQSNKDDVIRSDMNYRGHQTQQEHWERQHRDFESCKRLAGLYYRAGFRRVSFTLQNPSVSVSFYEKQNWNISVKSTIDPSQAMDRMTRMTIDDLINRIIKKEKELLATASATEDDTYLVPDGNSSIQSNPHSIFGLSRQMQITPRQRLINYCVLNVFIGLVDGLTKVASRQGSNAGGTASWNDVGRQKALDAMESVVKFARNILPNLPDGVLDYGLQFARAICSTEDLRGGGNSTSVLEEKFGTAADLLRGFVSEYHHLYQTHQMHMILDRVAAVGAGQLHHELTERYNQCIHEDKSIYAIVEEDIVRHF